MVSDLAILIPMCKGLDEGVALVFSRYYHSLPTEFLFWQGFSGAQHICSFSTIQVDLSVFVLTGLFICATKRVSQLTSADQGRSEDGKCETYEDFINLSPSAGKNYGHPPIADPGYHALCKFVESPLCKMVWVRQEIAAEPPDGPCHGSAR